MMQGTYTAALGILSQQQRLDTIANNLANLQTVGFKNSRADFKDALYRQMQRPEDPQTNNLLKGHGTLVSGFVRSFSPGSYSETTSMTDMYIDGQGFFPVQTPVGEILYTRAGNFQRSAEADGDFLVTVEGYYVLDENGGRIDVGGNDIRIDPDGSCYRGVEEVPYARIQLVDFPNRNGLTAASANMFAQSDASGAPRAADARIDQYAIEGSNVSMADEFSRMIRASRIFQLCSRALSTADSMDQTAISTRR